MASVYAVMCRCHPLEVLQADHLDSSVRSPQFDVPIKADRGKLREVKINFGFIKCLTFSALFIIPISSDGFL